MTGRASISVAVLAVALTDPPSGWFHGAVAWCGRVHARDSCRTLGLLVYFRGLLVESAPCVV